MKKKKNTQIAESKGMNAIQFVKNVIIGEIGPLAKNSPYLSFVLMASGFSAIGQLLPNNKGVFDFKNAFLKLDSLKKYRPFLNKYELYFKFYIPMVRDFKPSGKILLTSGSKNSRKHLTVNKDGFLILHSERMFKDLKAASLEVCKKIKSNPEYIKFS